MERYEDMKTSDQVAKLKGFNTLASLGRQVSVFSNTGRRGAGLGAPSPLRSSVLSRLDPGNPGTCRQISDLVSIEVGFYYNPRKLSKIMSL